MAGYIAEVDAPEVVRQITVKVKFKNFRVTQWRLNLAATIIKFAVWIGGFGGVKFEDSDT
jgi:hypothetical protein